MKGNEATPGRDVERRSQELSGELAQSPLEGWLETLKKILQGEVKTVEEISEMLGTLAREMKDVAQEAESSPTALPVEGETLRLVAEASERMAGELLKSAELVKKAPEGSMRMSWLYLAVRSDRASEPVLIWPQFVATARSAMVTSSVSPERCDITAA